MELSASLYVHHVAKVKVGAVEREGYSEGMRCIKLVTDDGAVFEVNVFGRVELEVEGGEA